MNQQLQPLELWLPDIKKYIVELLSSPLKAAKFEFNKVDYSFRRPHGKHFEEFSFLFVNQFPVNYRLGFLLQIWNHEVKTIKTNYPFQSKTENYKLRSLVLFMSNFVAEAAPAESGNAVNDYVLVTNKDLFIAGDHLLMLLQDHALPLAEQLSDINGLDAFFADRPGWSVSSLNHNNMSTELIAAKLNGQRNYHELFQEMNEAIEHKIAGKEMLPDTKIFLHDFYDYLKGK
jgi:hypothetical protein